MKKIICATMMTAIFGIVSAHGVKTSPVAPPDKDSVRAALSKINKLYGQAYAQGDSSLFLHCYTPDGAVMAANAPILGGKNGLLVFFKAAYKMGIRDVQFTTIDLYGLTNEYVTEQGVYEMLDANNQSMGKGKYLVLWKKTEEGWKMYRDMFNGDGAPQAMGK